jgi:hypothetical protein
VEFYLSAERCTVEAAVLPRMSKAAVERIERFFSFSLLPARSKRATPIGSSTLCQSTRASSLAVIFALLAIPLRSSPRNLDCRTPICPPHIGPNKRGTFSPHEPTIVEFSTTLRLCHMEKNQKLAA